MNKWRWSIKLRGYRSWLLMRSRCHNPRGTGYERYGAKGIIVCDRWRDSYDNFMDDMGVCPPEMTIDRIDGSGNYEPGNCRWATQSVQMNNRRDYNRRFVHEGRAQTMSEWAHEIGIRPGTLRERLNRMPFERAYTDASLRKERSHGTDKMYSKYKCRCDKCRSFNAEKAKKYRAKRRQEYDL